jgi:hypothetical protein
VSPNEELTHSADFFRSGLSLSALAPALCAGIRILILATTQRRIPTVDAVYKNQVIILQAVPEDVWIVPCAES